MKPYSPASERNREPIVEVLRLYFTGAGDVLEIGAGTGQHAVHFAQALPALTWWPTDRPENLPGIRAWADEAGLSNLRVPSRLDVRDRPPDRPWPLQSARYVYSANTAHIMSWPEVESMFEGIGEVLHADGVFCLYGPFNRQGEFTSDSNRAFDASLRAREPAMGLRDDREIVALGERHGLAFVADHALPANNRLLVFRRLPRD